MEKKTIFEQIVDENNERIINIEDFFDLKKISPKDLKSIITDLRIYFMDNFFNNEINENGELLLREAVGDTMSVKEIRQELSKIGFKQWQITSKIMNNKVRVITLYVDIFKNTEIIINKMYTCGWDKSSISPRTYYKNIPIRIISFDPREQKTLNKEVRKFEYLYHKNTYLE